jgi:hypothetical protein
MLSRSREALRHAWALKRHLSELSHGNFAGGSAAQARIRAMIREHARVVERETKGLRLELQPIFLPSAAAKGSEEAESLGDVAAAIQRVLDASSFNEKAIRMSFALSSGDQSLYIKTEEFWQSMRRVEALAAKLQEWQ